MTRIIKLKTLRMAFTLMEILVVVTIIGVVAAFAIPNYYKAVERSHVKAAQNDLRILYAAQEAYKAYNGDYWQSGLTGDLNLINTTLGLKIFLNGMAFYVCDSGPGWFMCFADRGQGVLNAINYGATSYQIYGYAVVISSTNANPVCDGLECP